MPLEVFHGFHCLFIDGLVLFAPFFHLGVAVTGHLLFGEKWLSGFFHGENVIEDNDFIEFISRETELIFNPDEAFGLEFIVKFVALLIGLLFG